jgi:hypothetical protein
MMTVVLLVDGQHVFGSDDASDNARCQWCMPVCRHACNARRHCSLLVLIGKPNQNLNIEIQVFWAV